MIPIVQNKKPTANNLYNANLFAIKKFYDLAEVMNQISSWQFGKNVLSDFGEVS